MEAIIDMKNCDVKTFTRKSLKQYFKILCDEKIDMVRDKLIFWDDHNVAEEYKMTEPQVRCPTTKKLMFEQIKRLNIVR